MAVSVVDFRLNTNPIRTLYRGVIQVPYVEPPPPEEPDVPDEPIIPSEPSIYPHSFDSWSTGIQNSGDLLGIPPAADLDTITSNEFASMNNQSTTYIGDSGTLIFDGEMNDMITNGAFTLSFCVAYKTDPAGERFYALVGNMAEVVAGIKIHAVNGGEFLIGVCGEGVSDIRSMSGLVSPTEYLWNQIYLSYDPKTSEMVYGVNGVFNRVNTHIGSLRYASHTMFRDYGSIFSFNNSTVPDHLPGAYIRDFYFYDRALTAVERKMFEDKYFGNRLFGDGTSLNLPQLVFESLDHSCYICTGATGYEDAIVANGVKATEISINLDVYKNQYPIFFNRSMDKGSLEAIISGDQGEESYLRVYNNGELITNNALRLQTVNNSAPFVNPTGKGTEFFLPINLLFNRPDLTSTTWDGELEFVWKGSEAQRVTVHLTQALQTETIIPAEVKITQGNAADILDYTGDAGQITLKVENEEGHESASVVLGTGDEITLPYPTAMEVYRGIVTFTIDSGFSAGYYIEFKVGSNTVGTGYAEAGMMESQTMISVPQRVIANESADEGILLIELFLTLNE